jgi:phospholipase/carboxylesterase
LKPTLALLLSLLSFVAAQPVDPLDPAAVEFLKADPAPIGRRADSCYQAKDYTGAARLYLEALRSGARDAGTIYNLACCYGLLDRAGLAARAIERAARAGFRDLDHARNDPDFALVRDSAVFAAAIESIAVGLVRDSVALGRLQYFSAGTYLPCRVLLPEGYDSTKSCRLVVGLHGYGATAESFAGLWSRFGTPGFIFAVPEAPYAYTEEPQLGYSWWPDRRTDSVVDESAGVRTDRYVVELARELGRRYRVSDIYLLGFSQGAGLSYQIGIRHPDVFRGIAPFGGWLDTTNVAAIDSAAGRLRVLIGHGREDQVIPYEKGTSARDFLKRHGYKVRLFDFAGGHRVPAELCREFSKWLDEK